MRYKELLKKQEWQDRRLQILVRDNYTCTSCGASKCELHVHHRDYLGDRAPWDYHDNDLTTLCDDCHEKETFGRQKVEKHLFATLNSIGLSYFQILGLAVMLNKYEGARKELIEMIDKFINSDL